MKFILTSLVIICSFSISAQPNDGDIFEAVTDTPINTGIYGMVLISLAYAQRKMNKRNNK
jgi:hypothetical protein